METNQKNMEEVKTEIEDLGLKAIKNYFEVDIKKLDNDTLRIIHERAKMGMAFEREMGVQKRAIEMNYIRVFRMIAEDKAELKKYIKKAMPMYYPA